MCALFDGQHGGVVDSAGAKVSSRQTLVADTAERLPVA
jgi:hypothetical protein